MELFSPQETCPCCHTAGLVVALVRRDTADGVYHCPACGLGWPGGNVFDIDSECDSIAVIAPYGVRLPFPHELPPDVVPASPDDVALWGPYIQELLEPAPPPRA